METKVCTQCGRELPVEDFGMRDKTKGTRRANCKQCHSNYMKQKYQDRKSSIQDLKSQYACAKCGDSRGYVLDFHHIDPETKLKNIARLTSNNYNLNTIYDEVKKCVVLCANCHREFHYMQRKNKKFTLDDYLSYTDNNVET